MRTMEIEVHIEGEGVAAACCAQLFSESGQPLASSRVVRPKLGAVLLSRQTVALLAGIFPLADLVSVGHPIQKRVVAWGQAAEPITLPHSALVISEADLLTRLWAQVPSAGSASAGGWKFLSSAASSPQQQAFGTRVASVARAVLKRDADQSACWIESVDSGWLFLLPRGENEAATLIAVGETPGALLSQSRIIAGLIGAWKGRRRSFPRIRVLPFRFAATVGSPAALRRSVSTHSAARALATPRARPILLRRSLPQFARESRWRICWRTIRRGRCTDFFVICRFASASIKAAVRGRFGSRKQHCSSRESNGPGGSCGNRRNRRLID